MFGDERLDEIFLVIEPLLVDSDKYKQRAGAEILSGVLRGEQFVSSRVSWSGLKATRFKALASRGFQQTLGVDC